MIGSLTRAWDNLLGRGEAAVTVPPLDGALRPNRRLDEAAERLPLAEVDSLAVVSGRLLAAAGETLYALDDAGTWQRRGGYEAEIACLAAIGERGLAVALADGRILLEGEGLEGRRLDAPEGPGCITALAAAGSGLYLAIGSTRHAAADWQADLLQRNASGSIWRIDLEDGSTARIAQGLAYPAGLALDGESLVYSEAWKHRLVRLPLARAGRPEVLAADLPGYPGRLSAGTGGHWLAVFAPRSQLVELVLREPHYRDRMLAEVARPFWIAPKLRSGRTFYEPLQGGAVKHLGLLKPWAPTLSAGLCVRLDAGFQPQASLHSRADGATHGVTAAVEQGGRLYVAARGDGLVVSLALEELGDEA